jgi:hypothetical protein
VLWSNLTVSPDSRPTANALLLKAVGGVYTLPPPAPAAPATSR